MNVGNVVSATIYILILPTFIIRGPQRLKEAKLY